MLLGKIRCFISIVEKRSFTKTALDMGLSQSAVSQQMKSLEEELGTELFTRHNRTFSLTPAGEHFYRQMKAFVPKFDQICRETALIGSEDDNTLTIGYPFDYEGDELGKAVIEFSSIYPDVTVSMFAGNHESLYARLRSNEADMIINDQRRAFSEEYVNLVLAKIPYIVELPASHPLAQRDGIEIEELSFMNMIVIASQEQQSSEMSYFRDSLNIQSPVLFAENRDIARLMAESGKGYILKLPNGKVSGKTYLPLMRNGSDVICTLCAFWKKARSGYNTEEFAKLLQKQFIR